MEKEQENVQECTERESWAEQVWEIIDLRREEMAQESEMIVAVQEIAENI